MRRPPAGREHRTTLVQRTPSTADDVQSTGIGHFTNIEVLLHKPFRKRPASCSEQFSVYYATVHSLYFALEYIALAYIYININYL